MKTTEPLPAYFVLTDLLVFFAGIDAVRRRLGMKWVGVAHRADTSPSLLCRWRNGKVEPCGRQLYRIAAAVGAHLVLHPTDAAYGRPILLVDEQAFRGVLRQILRRRDMSMAAYGRRFGMSRSAVSQYLGGRNDIRSSLLWPMAGAVDRRILLIPPGRTRTTTAPNPSGGES